MVGGPQPWPHHLLVQPKVARISLLHQTRFGIRRVLFRFRFGLGTESCSDSVSESKV
jgi:hypothetical protein